MRTKRDDEALDELRPEYDLAELLKHGVQGKYAKRCQKGTNLVLLDPDVARAFPTEEAVNEALRLVIRLAKVPGRRKRAIAKAETVERSVKSVSLASEAGRQGNSFKSRAALRPK